MLFPVWNDKQKTRDQSGAFNDPVRHRLNSQLSGAARDLAGPGGHVALDLTL